VQYVVLLGFPLFFSLVRRPPPDHPLLDNALNLGPLISRWEINKFENCWYKSVRILQVLKLLFQQFLNLSSFYRDMSGLILGALSNNRWSGGSSSTTNIPFSCHRITLHRHGLLLPLLVSWLNFYRNLFSL
jgi:hypothetical protein